MSLKLPQENIVRFIDVGQKEYVYYIFTEMIHGTTLHDHYIYQRNIFTELETRNIFQQICEAVNYLHQRGIVHRDIKSEVRCPPYFFLRAKYQRKRPYMMKLNRSFCIDFFRYVLIECHGDRRLQGQVD